MARSEFKKAIYASLATAEERQVIDRFYAMSNRDFQVDYSENLGELMERFDRTRLRSYQRDNIRTRHDRLEEQAPRKGFITTLPAGAGKTEIFTQTILTNAIEVTEGSKVKLITPPTIILVPSVDLVKQTYEDLKDRTPHLMVGLDYGKEKDIQPLTITTYDTFVLKVEEGKIRPGDISLIIMDEAHRGLSDTRLNIFRRFLDNALTDAYSASPAFDAMKSLYELLGKDSVLPGPNDRELTTMGYLAECHNVLMCVSVKTEDLPEALRNNPERYNDFLEELKIQAAKEFYLTYVDEQTGQRAFGKPAVGFARYVRHAQRAAEVFDEAIREHAANDSDAAELVSGYSHPTQVLSRSMGDREVDAAFNRLLPKERRTADEGENLITFTTKMAREGTNVPRWKVAIGIQTPNSSVDQVQTRGRARRPVGDELSFVLDVFVEEDGKIRGKPKFYYEAIDDPSIVRGVITVRPDQEKIDAVSSEVLEFKNKREMKELVLGNGDAARKSGKQFDKLWDQIEVHAKAEGKKKKPEPYLLDKELVSYKFVVRNGDTESEETTSSRQFELRISETAMDQFRATLGIAGQINSRWLSSESLREAVIGKIIDPEDDRPVSDTARLNNERAEYYQSEFDALLRRARKHLEQQGDTKHPKPFIVAGDPLKMQERLDDEGNIVLAFHVDSVQVLKRALDVAPTPGQRFYNQQHFEIAVLEGTEDQDRAVAKRKLAKAWDKAEHDYPHTRRPGMRTTVPFFDGKAEAANCFIGQDADLEFSLERSSIATARRALGIAAITFDPTTITWDKDITAIEKITSIRDNVSSLPQKTEEWIPRRGVEQLIGTSNDNKRWTQLWERLERLCSNGQPAEIDGRAVKFQKMENSTGQAFYIHASEIGFLKQQLGKNLPPKTKEWKSKKEAERLVRTSKLNEQWNQLWGGLEKLCSTGQPAEVGERPIKFQEMQSGFIQVFCVHVSEIGFLKKHLGKNLPPKTKEWKSKAEAAALVNIDKDGERWTQLWEQLEELYNNDQPIKINKHPVKFQKMESGNQQAFCVHVSEIEFLKGCVGKNLPPKTKEWKSRKEATRLLKTHGDNERWKQLWDGLEKLCSADQPVEINDHPLKFQKMESGKRQAFCVHVSEIEFLKGCIGKNLPLKTKDWKNKKEAISLVGVSNKNERYNQLWQQLEGLCSNGQPAEVARHPVKFQKMQSGTRDPFCIHVSEIPWLKVQVGKGSDAAVSKAEDDPRAHLKSKPTTPRTSPAHQTKEEREAAKRNGYKRG